MITQAQLLVGNFAVVGLFITAWMQVEFALSKYSWFWQAGSPSAAPSALPICPTVLAVQNGTGSLSPALHRRRDRRLVVRWPA